MRRVLLVNPNTSADATRMMVAMAQEVAGAGVCVRGVTAPTGPAMITTPAALEAAADAVVAIGAREGAQAGGVIVAAFGDPGVAALRARLAVPVTGICEAAMREAATSGRRFAVATTTPALVPRIDAMAALLGLAHHYAGTWVAEGLAEGDPAALLQDPPRLEAALAAAVRQAIRDGTAAAVIIGGGPLSQAATRLAGRFTVPVIAPVAAAMRALLRHWSGGDADRPG